jgi:sterol desaturase/sphingolipid hydroxylase (fatty acid hydroxylase superfamily)
MIPLASIGLVGWGVLLFALERLWPAAPAPRNPMRLLRNLGLGALVIAVGPLVQWGIETVFRSVEPLFQTRSLFLQLLILDLWTYGMHRAYHRVPFMWRMHGAHHLDEHLDVMSAARFHVAEILWSSVMRLIPLWIFGMPLEVNLIFGTILTACALFHHSNIRLPDRFEQTLSKVIVTPSIHWVHHHALQRDTDSNYAAILSIWDRVFRSRSTTARWPDMPIGTQGEREVSFPALLLLPFWKKN